ncbi:MAG: hypothetical protein KJ622_12025 [Alphaproteobacteria bacterium]|nr:hypothetical protein [Alphaproteobacteria bacterium]
MTFLAEDQTFVVWSALGAVVSACGHTRGRMMGKKQPPTEPQKTAYLSENMGYEIGMLHYAIEKLVTCNDTGHELSMRYECFSVHARNLGNFLINKDDGSYQAHDFNNNFRPAKQTRKDRDILALLNLLNSKVFHLVAKRDEVKDFTVGNAVDVYNWVIKELKRFGDELPDEHDYKKAWGNFSTDPQNLVVGDRSKSANGHAYANTSSTPVSQILAQGPTITSDGTTVNYRGK